MSSLKYISDPDLMTVTLTSDYTAGDGHMHLTAGHGARLPTTGDFWIRTTSGALKVHKVTARTDDTITTSAVIAYAADANLPAGTELAWSLTPDALDQLRADLVQTNADASKAVTKAGSLYLPSDGFLLYRDTGAILAPWGPIFPCVAHDDSGFSWENQESATVVTANGGVHISTPAHTDGHLHIRYKTKTGTYKITVGVIVHLNPQNINSFGIGWRQSSDGKVVLLNLQYNSKLQFEFQKWSSSTAWTAAYGTYDLLHRVVLFLQIEVDSTNRICRHSLDGQNFLTLHSVSKTDYITPDQVVYVIKAQNSTYGCGATIFSWKEE